MEWAAYVTACECPCHFGSVQHPESVPVTDVIEAAVACDTCRHLHCPALRTPEPPPAIPRNSEPWQDAANFCQTDKGEGAE